LAFSAIANVGGDPVEVMSFTNDGPATAFNIVIMHFAGPFPELIKYVRFAAPVAWERGMTDVIVRYETSGGRTARPGTGVSDRTVYGDGFVVWTDQEVEPTPGFASSVWTGRLDPATIQGLLRSAVDGGFFALEGSYRPTHPLPSPVADPIPLPLDVRSETLAISLADHHHQVSVRPAGWPGAPAVFRELRDAVLSLMPIDSQRFIPQTYLLQVIPLPGKNADDYPRLPRSRADLDLAAGSAVPLVLERTQGEALAALLNDLGATLAQDGRVFYLQLLAVPPRAP